MMNAIATETDEDSSDDVIAALDNLTGGGAGARADAGAGAVGSGSGSVGDDGRGAGGGDGDGDDSVFMEIEFINELTGRVHPTLGGVFMMNPEVQHKQNIWQKVDDHELWLRIKADATWLLSATVNKDAMDHCGLALQKKPSMTPTLDYGVSGAC